MPDTKCDHRQRDIATGGPYPCRGEGAHHINTLTPLPSIHSSSLGFLLAEPIQKLEEREVSVEKIPRCQSTGSQSCVGGGQRVNLELLMGNIQNATFSKTFISFALF